MGKLKVLVLMHEDIVPPDDVEGLSHREMLDFKAEYDVMAAIADIGHEPIRVGLYDDLAPLRDAHREHGAHIAFNLLEEFHGLAHFDQHVVSYLELLQLPYTGCNPRGLTIARDKALTKKILAYHRVAVPHFAVFARGRKVRRPKKLEFPLLVKSLTEEASLSISQASVVHDDRHLIERVELVHRTTGTDAIAEQYIDGREVYVGVIGNARLVACVPWELHFDKWPEDAPRIATRKVKWDPAYQKKVGIRSARAQDLPSGVQRKLPSLAKRIYRLLGLSGYARLDFRLSADGRAFFLEANPNPYIAFGEDFAEAAHVTGIDYDALIQRILRLGLQYRRQLWS